MPQGTVKSFKSDRGFGFIASDEGGGDIFVHVSELEKTGVSSLTSGQKVTFDLERDRRTGKMRAANARIVG